MHFGLVMCNLSDAMSLLWYLCRGRRWEGCLSDVCLYIFLLWEGIYTASCSSQRISMKCIFFLLSRNYEKAGSSGGQEIQQMSFHAQ